MSLTKNLLLIDYPFFSHSLIPSPLPTQPSLPTSAYATPSPTTPTHRAWQPKPRVRRHGAFPEAHWGLILQSTATRSAAAKTKSTSEIDFLIHCPPRRRALWQHPPFHRLASKAPRRAPLLQGQIQSCGDDESQPFPDLQTTVELDTGSPIEMHQLPFPDPHPLPSSPDTFDRIVVLTPPLSCVAPLQSLVTVYVI